MHQCGTIGSPLAFPVPWSNYPCHSGGVVRLNMNSACVDALKGDSGNTRRGFAKEGTGGLHTDTIAGAGRCSDRAGVIGTFDVEIQAARGTVQWNGAGAIGVVGDGGENDTGFRLGFAGVNFGGNGGGEPTVLASVLSGSPILNDVSGAAGGRSGTVGGHRLRTGTSTEHGAALEGAEGGSVAVAGRWGLGRRRDDGNGGGGRRLDHHRRRRHDTVTIPGRTLGQVALAGKVSVLTARGGESQGNVPLASQSRQRLLGRTGATRAHQDGCHGFDGRGWGWRWRRCLHRNLVDLGGEAIGSEAILQDGGRVGIGGWHGAEGADDRTVHDVLLADHLAQANVHVQGNEVALRSFGLRFYLLGGSANGTAGTRNHKGGEREESEKRGKDHDDDCLV